MKGHTEILKILAEAGADLNMARVTDGVTPIFVAAQNGHLDVVRYLLSVHDLQLKPFISTADSLRTFANQRDEGVQNRMAELLQSKLDAGEPENNISVLPQEIAVVMGHHYIMEEFSKHNVAIEPNCCSDSMSIKK